MFLPYRIDTGHDMMEFFCNAFVKNSSSAGPVAFAFSRKQRFTFDGCVLDQEHNILQYLNSTLGKSCGPPVPQNNSESCGPLETNNFYLT